jgi:hypothetical protein
MARGFLAATAVALALVAAGSAQAGDGFAQKADKVCARAARSATIEYQKYAPKTGSLTAADIRKFAKLYAVQRTLLKDELRQLDPLGGPSSGAARSAYAKWRSLLLTVAIPRFDATIKAALAGDAKKMLAASQGGEAIFAKALKLQKTIGLKTCAYTG